MSPIRWRGIEIEVTHTENWLNTDLDPIKVRAVSTTPLPITATGYRSHFIDPADLLDYGDAAAFVLYWLEAAAKDWDAQIPLL